MRRPRILYAVTDPMSILLVRGQLRYLREAGADVFFVSSPGALAEDIAREEGVSFVPVTMARAIAPGADLRSLRALWQVVREVEPDIVTVSTPKASLLGGIVSWATRTPVRVQMLQGLRMETATGGLRWLLGSLQLATSLMSHRVVCISPSLRDLSTRLHVVERDKAMILAAGSCNGVDTTRFSRRPEVLRAAAALRTSLGIAPGQRVIGFVGRLTRDKGLVELEEAWRGLRARFDAHLLVIGGEEPGDLPPEDTMRRLREDPRVHLAGMQRDVPPWYALMDVMTLPTYREGLGYVLLEANAMEVPVVATRTTGVIDAVADGETATLVPVRDAAALEAAIAAYLLDPALAARHGAAGRRRVVEGFESRVLWDAWAGLYNELLAGAGVDATLSAPAVPRAGPRSPSG